MHCTMQLTTAVGVFIVTFGMALPQEADIQGDYCNDEIIEVGLLQMKMEVQASAANALLLESKHSSSANRVVAVAMPDQDLQFLEDESLKHGVEKTRAMSVSASMNKSCRPSVFVDGGLMFKHLIGDRNKTLIQEYKRDGKILASGIPSLNFVHIPKTGGDSFSLAATPLGEYSMSWANWAIIKAGLTWSDAQAPAMYLDANVAKVIYGESTVFCAIRDPIKRAWSAACHHSQYGLWQKPCHSPNECILNAIEIYNSGIINVGDWFWASQVDYLKGIYGCTELLDFDNLKDEYERVTQKYGFGDFRLPTSDETHVCSVKCGNTSNMSPQARALLDAHFAKDIEFYKEFKSNRTRLNDSK